MKKIIIATLISIIALAVKAADSTKTRTISILTCYPQKELYTKFGHTAIRYQDKEQGTDIVINYGLFNPNAPHFITKFILGDTEYQVGMQEYGLFMDIYREENRKVIEQTLNIDGQDIQDIIRAIAINLLPENATYTYNVFKKNCTTQARDVILSNIQGETAAPEQEKTTYRRLLQTYIQDNPWLQFGINLILGYGADSPLTTRQTQFLPIELMASLEKTRINGRHLVQERHTVVEPSAGGNSYPAEKNTKAPLPIHVATGIFLIALLTTTAAIRKSGKMLRGALKVIDTALILLISLAGIILVVLALSKHPTTTGNLLLLMINPLPATIIYQTVRGKQTKFTQAIWVAWMLLTVLTLVGSWLQTYPSPIYLIAATILVRGAHHIRQSRCKPSAE